MNPDRAVYRKTVQSLSGGRVAVYYPALAQQVGGLKAALMLSQLLYWNGIRRGWAYKSVEDMQRETGLTKAEQQTARKALLERGLIEARLKGIPRIWHYRVRLDRLADLMGMAVEAAPLTEAVEQPEADELPEGSDSPEIEEAQDPQGQPGVADFPEAGGASSGAVFTQTKPHPVEAPLDDNLTDIGTEPDPTSGGNSAQLNKVLKITTQTPKYIEREQQIGGQVRPQPAPTGKNDGPEAASNGAGPGKQIGNADPSQPPESGAGSGKRKEPAGQPGLSRAKSSPAGNNTLPPPQGGLENAGGAGGEAGNGAGKVVPPPDTRWLHPAVGLVKQVTGCNPPRVVLDRVIYELGDEPDAARFAKVYEEWCARGYRPTNLAGLLEWYREGIPYYRRKPEPARARQKIRIDESPPSQADIDHLRAQLRAVRG